MKLSGRFDELPPYLFAEIDKAKKQRIKRGYKVIDLGVGDPDTPTPTEIIETAKSALDDPKNHRYPSYEGLFSLRETFAQWYEERFGDKMRITLDPLSEIITLIGSKEGIAHIHMALIDTDDVVIVPDPAYPVYSVWTKFCGGRTFKIPLMENNGFLPDLKSIPKEVLSKAKIFWVCYPNNPTSAIATERFYEELVYLARRYDFIVAADMAYSEIYTGEPKPMSVLQIDGAKEVTVEFHSFSKTFNMTGWRIGMAVGNKNVIEALLKIKTNTDSGVFQAIQLAVEGALKNYSSLTEQVRQTYKRRRKIVEEALDEGGLLYHKSNATFYVWVKVGDNSRGFAKSLLEKHGIVVTPGIGFGEAGEGYIRISLTVSDDELKEACTILKGLKFA